MWVNSFVIAMVFMFVVPGTQARAAGVQEARSGSFSPGVSTDLLESIDRSRYEIVEDATEPGSFRANNPQQGLRATFTAQGVQVFVDASEVEWGMQLFGHGRMAHIVPAARANIVVDRDRIEYRRDGITEWYFNSQIGIEQGFTIHQRPTGHGELVVDLGVSGGLAAERVGEDLVFQGAGANVSYAKLHAFDATGRPLESRMELLAPREGARTEGSLRLRLFVADADARYPVVVDPIIGVEKKIVPFDPEFGALFAFSVSISGDTAVVGSRDDDPAGAGILNSGSAYIYQRNFGGTNNWGLVKKITASDATAGDLFGNSVSISGDTLLVGSKANSGGIGAAYVFERDLGGVDNWGEVTKLTASDGAPIDLFGESVSIDGDTVLVGAWRNSDAGADSGSAYIFQRDFGGVDNWGEVKKIIASDATANYSFGSSVSLSGDTALIGSVNADWVFGVNSTGAAYVFERDLGGVDNWGEVTKINSSDAESGDAFGGSVAISGDYAIVGAPGDDDAGSASGSMYIYERNSGGVDNWGEFIKILASDGALFEQFGGAVAIDGDTVLVGGHGDDGGGGSFSGSAYLFRKDSGGIGNWGEVIKLTASDASVGADFGFSVGISGSELIVGAYNESTAAGAAGAAYVYMDTDVAVVPALSATGMVLLLLLLMTTPVVAGIYRTRRVERGN